MSDQNNSTNNTDPADPQQQTNNNPQPNQVTITGNYISGTNGGQWITAVPIYTNGWTIGYTNIATAPTATPAPVEAPTEAKKKEKDKDGCFCKKCKDFFPYAEPNQEDGTLICYACRKGW